MKEKFLKDGPSGGSIFVFAHGAGAGMDSPWMTTVSAALALQGIQVWRFDFDWMDRIRASGRRAPPPTVTGLIAEYRALVDSLDVPVVIGGKSMGGRVATMLAADQCPAQVRGCLCLGYPFHPRNPEKVWRTAHLDRICIPLQIVQGEQDPFGRRKELDARADLRWLDQRIRWIPGGDHDFTPGRRSVQSGQGNIEEVVRTAVDFIGGVFTVPVRL